MIDRSPRVIPNIAGERVTRNHQFLACGIKSKQFSDGLISVKSDLLVS